MDWIQFVRDNPPLSEAEYGYWVRIGKVAGVSSERIRGRIRKAFKKKLGIKASVKTLSDFVYEDVSEGEAFLNTNKNAFTYVGTAVKNVEEMLEEMGIDQDQYEIVKLEPRVWTTPIKSEKGPPIVVANYRLAANLKAKSLTGEELRKEFEEAARSYKIPSFQIERKETKVDPQLSGIISIFDAHIDRLAWSEVVGENGDLNKGVANFKKAFDSLLTYVVNEGIHTLFFPIGNDFFNTNNNGATKRGTPQPYSDHPKKAFLVGVNLLRECIDKALQYIPEIVVPYVLANHDEDEAWKAAVCLKYIYEKEPRVFVDEGPKPIKAYHWGVNMFAFEHGHVGKAVDAGKIVAELFKEMHAATSYRLILRGHYHSKRDPKTIDTVGYTVRHLRSMSIASEWEFYSYYIGVPKGCEAFLHHREFGPCGNLDKIFF